MGLWFPNPLDPFNGHYRQSKGGPPRRVMLVFLNLSAVIIVPPLCYGVYLAAHAISSSRQASLALAVLAFLAVVFLCPVAYDAVRKSRNAEKEERSREVG